MILHPDSPGRTESPAFQDQLQSLLDKLSSQMEKQEKEDET